MNKVSVKVILTFLCMFPILLKGQPEVFSLADFELRGPVRICTVLTDYGEERFEFDREGRLTKSLTRFSDSEYNITYYRYQGPDLSERRDEVYRDGGFDKAASFARFYDYDTLAAKVVEKITSYDQLIREQLTYEFDSIGRLEGLVRIHKEGIDETQVKYIDDKGEETATYYLNGQVSKSIRKSEKAGTEGLSRVILTKEYFQEAPQKAVEQVRDSMDRLLLETRFGYDQGKKEFMREEMHAFAYGPEGYPISQTIRYYRNSEKKPAVYRSVEKEFVYQQDGKSPGNWIRKITTPDNSFSTRKIEYYDPDKDIPADSLPKNHP